MTIQKLTQDEMLNLQLSAWGRAKAVTGAGRAASDISGKRLRITEEKIQNFGIWEASPGDFQREAAQAEFMLFLSGECSFKPEGADELAIKAGDCLFLPAGTNGIWRIKSVTRKLYLLV